ncbi:MAG: class I SAM-dependent methyltransferase [Actinomycetales bacterium]|nr:class I SAM-dependent methyltransferase [Actinomycetales bacterium]
MDRVRLELTWRTLVDAAPLEPRSRVFEIGFGAGALLARFAHAGHTVGGCDPDQLKVGVDPAIHRDGLIFDSGIEEVVVPEERFDLVYGIHVIEHVQDIVKTVQSALNLLNPGGRLVLFTPGGDSLSLKTFSDAWWLLEDPTHIRFFSRRSLQRLLYDHGYAKVDISRALTDNLTMEGASLLRLLHRPSSPGGVLTSAPRRLFATAVAPFALLLRLLVPRWRPTLVVTASSPSRVNQ